MKDHVRTCGLEQLDPVFVKLSRESLKQHLAQTIDADFIKQMTLEQRKIHASKPLYLIRYE